MLAIYMFISSDADEKPAYINHLDCVVSKIFQLIHMFISTKQLSVYIVPEY